MTQASGDPEAARMNRPPNFDFPTPPTPPTRKWLNAKKWYQWPNPIDNRLVRLISFFVFLSALTILIFGVIGDNDEVWYLVPFLFFDFFVRTIFGPVPFSPLGVLSTIILKIFRIKTIMVPSPAKRFSAFLGIVLNTVLFNLRFTLDSELQRGPVIVLTLFAFMESVLGFCVGCWIFGAFFRWRDARELKGCKKKLIPPPGPAKKGGNLVRDRKEPEFNHGFDYDLIVIGGGSGGMAASKEAARLGRKVVVLDYVTPSLQGKTWGLGGTCVNVGCIPKKLYHQAAQLGIQIHERASYGWVGDVRDAVRSTNKFFKNTAIQLGEKQVPMSESEKSDLFKEVEVCGLTDENSENGGKRCKPTHQWPVLKKNILRHISSLNQGYVSSLRSQKVQYLNALGSFVDSHTIRAEYGNGKHSIISGRRILVAVGGRPRMPIIPGIEHAISSDELFHLDESPKKTLVVGASYIALECAGFLTGLGCDTHVMVRSKVLREFDQDVAERVEKDMIEEGINFIPKSVPTKIEKTDAGLKVFYKKSSGDSGEQSEVFDTVLFAIGRTPCTKSLGLAQVGVKTAPNGKIYCYHERTTVPHIYAVGDVVYGGLELTPVAIKAGLLLVKRLYSVDPHGHYEYMDYTNVPTTVFTPLEYGSIGLSETVAKETFGARNLAIYHAEFTPLEWSIVPSGPIRPCYAKIICNLMDKERVIGFHYLGPNAGEVTQGFGTGFKLGMTKKDLDRVIGIHPVCAEEMVTLKTTKDSGVNPRKTGC